MSTQAERSYRWLFWCLALLGLAIDQASKYGVFAWLDNGGSDNSRQVLAGVFELQVRFTRAHDPGEGAPAVDRQRAPSVNKGALWGLGSGWNTAFAVISLGAAAAIILWSCRRKAAQEGYLCVALGLILAGTLGNFYDRIVFGGVRDFLHWYYWFDFPVFNFADCCLVIGAGLLLLQAFYGHPDTEDQPAQGEAAAQPGEVHPAAPSEHVAEVSR
jgi:lipoprotein signal peptidase